LSVTQSEKDGAFADRLARIESKYDISHLSDTAAFNYVRLPKLFELCEHGYRNEIDAWRADDFLFYCYFYDQTKYLNDVLFHSFHVDTSDTTDRRISSSGAFAAYCWVHRPDLHRSILADRDYFYVDPLTLIGKGRHYDEDRHPPEIVDQLKQFAQVAYERAQSIKPEDVIRL
jgi:hypothetical protein